jgi:hypothetical protein
MKNSPPFKIRKFQPFRNQARTMLGFLNIETPSGIVLYGCKLMIGMKGTVFVSMPAIKRVDDDGRPVLDDRGKPVWDSVVDFRNREARDKFNDGVLDAVRSQYPDAFAELERL